MAYKPFAQAGSVATVAQVATVASPDIDICDLSESEVDDYEERAAFHEFEAWMDRVEAERLALAAVLAKRTW